MGSRRMAIRGVGGGRARAAAHREAVGTMVCAPRAERGAEAGPARIPHHHHTILGYARAFGVPMEIMVNANRAARSEFAGHVFTNRQLIYDVRGQLTELLAKAIDRGALVDFDYWDWRALRREGRRCFRSGCAPDER